MIEFHQLISYKDVDLAQTLEEWERLYNFARPRERTAARSPIRRSVSGYPDPETERRARAPDIRELAALALLIV